MPYFWWNNDRVIVNIWRKIKHRINMTNERRMCISMLIRWHAAFRRMKLLTVYQLTACADTQHRQICCVCVQHTFMTTSSLFMTICISHLRWSHHRSSKHTRHRICNHSQNFYEFDSYMTHVIWKREKRILSTQCVLIVQLFTSKRISNFLLM